MSTDPTNGSGEGGGKMKQDVLRTSHTLFLLINALEHVLSARWQRYQRDRHSGWGPQEMQGRLL